MVTPFVCQLCGSKAHPYEILDLGMQPICNAFLKANSLTAKEPRFPLRLVLCRKCSLVQLADRVHREVVFGNEYNYLSGYTRPLLKYFDGLVDDLLNRFRSGGTFSVCDIGSNDGSFLRFFKSRGCKVLGIEPTPLPARIAESEGIPTIQDYFTEKTAERAVRSNGRVNLVTAMNVLAHADALHSVMSGVKTLLDKGGIFVNESHYLPSLVERLEYDTIYHEHMRYYTLHSLIKLHEMHGFHIFDARLTESYGGSILVFASLERKGLTERARGILEAEEKYQSIETYSRFSQGVKKNAEALRSLLLRLRREGKRTVGVGAPMKSTTLLNYCRIGPETLEYLTEVNPLKIGTLSPGVHIPVVDEGAFFSEQPDYALILSWNAAEDIIIKLGEKGYRGKFILPVPTPRIV